MKLKNNPELMITHLDATDNDMSKNRMLVVTLVLVFLYQLHKRKTKFYVPTFN